MFNSTLITLENSLLNPHTGGLPVTQKKRKKVNNKIYFLCTSGSMTVGLLCKPTSKIVGSVVGRGLGTYGLPITSHCYGRHHGYLKKRKGCSIFSNHYVRMGLSAAADSSFLLLLYLLYCFQYIIK